MRWAGSDARHEECAQWVDRLQAAGRLNKAKAFHAVARAALSLLEEARLDRAPALSNAALAAIAYSDAVIITADGKLNQKDHMTVLDLLLECLGREMPKDRLGDLRAILSLKDEVQYGARLSATDQAEQVLQRLDRFAEWARDWLATRGIR